MFGIGRKAPRPDSRPLPAPPSLPAPRPLPFVIVETLDVSGRSQTMRRAEISAIMENRSGLPALLESAIRENIFAGPELLLTVANDPAFRFRVTIIR